MHHILWGSREGLDRVALIADLFASIVSANKAMTQRALLPVSTPSFKAGPPPVADQLTSSICPSAQQRISKLVHARKAPIQKRLTSAVPCVFNLAKMLSHAMHLTIALLALARKVLLGRYRIGIHAKTKRVHQLLRAMDDDHNHINISWLLANCAPSVNHLTLTE